MSADVETAPYSDRGDSAARTDTGHRRQIERRSTLAEYIHAADETSRAALKADRNLDSGVLAMPVTSRFEFIPT